MKIFTRTIIALFVLPLFAMNTALAHNSLSVTNPADQALIQEAPEAIELNFSDETYLVEIKLEEVDGGIVLLDFDPSISASRHFSVPTPDLEDGNYQVKWMVEGDDTHKITGEFSFTVNAEADEHAGMNRGAADHGNHEKH